MRIAVIPARGGSKRIPGKNIKPFCGKPIIAYSIEAAQESSVFDRVIVSTDDEAIAECSRSYGAEVPFKRPSELSDDMTPTVSVIRHTLGFVENQGSQVSAICCIYATAPFIRAHDLRDAYHRLIQQQVSGYVFTATSFGFPIQRAFGITREGYCRMFQPEYYNARSQDLEEAFQDAGQFYWGKAEAFRNNVIFFSSASQPFVLPRHRVQDIDTFEDWRRAELLWRLNAAANESSTE